jgi:hypothetical protein
MTLIHHSASDHQVAVVTIDAGLARDIMLMLADAHAVLDDLASGNAPAAARQAAACLRDADSPYTLAALATALDEVTSWLHQARRGALAGIPPLS